MARPIFIITFLRIVIPDIGEKKRFRVGRAGEEPSHACMCGQGRRPQQGDIMSCVVPGVCPVPLFYLVPNGAAVAWFTVGRVSCGLGRSCCLRSTSSICARVAVFCRPTERRRAARLCQSTKQRAPRRRSKRLLTSARGSMEGDGACGELGSRTSAWPLPIVSFLGVTRPLLVSVTEPLACLSRMGSFTRRSDLAKACSAITPFEQPAAVGAESSGRSL